MMRHWRRPASQRLIISHFYDLVALGTWGEQRRQGRWPRTETVSAVRLAAIKADIVANLDDGNLNATMVSNPQWRDGALSAQAVRERGRQPTPSSCSASVWRGAHHNLRSPLHSGRAISTIAFDLGFQRPVVLQQGVFAGATNATTIRD